MKAFVGVMWCAAVSLLLSACESLGGAGGVGPGSTHLPDAMRDEPSKFVVVTVANPSHPLSVRAGATPRGYSNGGLYSVSSAAASTVREIEHDHGLHQVSAWPIESLGVHCIVFAVPSGSSAQQ